MEDKRTIYLTLHKSFVREGIPYTDKRTGEERTFNSVTLPKGTVIDGEDLSYYEFSPLYVNESRYRGDSYRDIPLLANKEVRLTKTVLDDEGRPLLDEKGSKVRDVVTAMPAAIKDGVDQAHSRYLSSLQDRAQNAREGSKAYARGSAPQSRQARSSDERGALAAQDIPF